MRTKQEVIKFLESKLGTKVQCTGNKSLDGQCVTLIKSLMEFLGVKDPYKARGHAKTAITAYLNEGIADKGTGFISVFSNKNMGGGYGHIWCNAGDGNGTYYESNGQKPLIVTKGKTYSYDSVCNFDKYIKEETVEQSDCQKQVEALQKEVESKNEQIGNYVKQVDGMKIEAEKLKTDHENEISPLIKKIDLHQLFKEDLAIRLGSPYTAEDDSIRSGIDNVAELKDQLTNKSQELSDCSTKTSELARLDKSWADTVSNECLTTVATPKGVKRGLQSFLKANQANPTLSSYSASDLITNLLRRIKWLRK